LYGVISFLVTQRTQEIGIRMAIGATADDVLRLVMSGALRWTLVGIVLGLAVATAVTRMLGSLLFGVQANDPWSLSAAVAILLLAASAAAWIPARRATRIDPLSALRHE
jgi:ABC-type antimicrobial peptide transport system permease subunit